ncbi:hypothetical protein E0L93_02510 [Rubrobacter taiwanensis]|uniref:PIN domain-containing protein n=1 Tax=Rubrobacter taiwanensis TaxID=185139 RepID=A0A4V2NX69_9ACTN|nr:hypothetical protein E0L93_02510 [Rubrobacter taiwanensis]
MSQSRLPHLRLAGGNLLNAHLVLREEEALVVPEAVYSEHLERAACRVPRDPDDIPTVALALALGDDQGRCAI